MRLIDADQFGVISLQGKSDDFIAGVAFMFDKIHEAPTVTIPIAKLDTTNDFAEWIDVNGDGSIMKCSKCGEEVCCKNNNFCSNCGAAMRTKESKPEKSGPCMTCTCIDDITGRCLVGHYCEEYIHWKEGKEDAGTS